MFYRDGTLFCYIIFYKTAKTKPLDKSGFILFQYEPKEYVGKDSYRGCHEYDEKYGGNLIPYCCPFLSLGYLFVCKMLERCHINSSIDG